MKVNWEFIQIIPLIRIAPTNEFSGNLTSITSSQHQLSASILPTDCRGCGRGRSPSSLTRTITINLANIGSTFYIDEHGTYFDNYGLLPLDFRFLSRLRRNSTHRWNTTQLQGLISQTCGQYCCVFLYFMYILYFMCNGYNVKQFLNCLTITMSATIIWL